jgi:predicted ester cyclase
MVIGSLAGGHAWADSKPQASAAHGAIADTDLPVPHHASGADAPGADILVRAARRYAAFWNTGDPQFAKAALASEFVDRTLPAGRVQGPKGPLDASAGFRAAVPDLRAEIDDLIVAGDRVAVHLHFRGHFTGAFQGVHGTGQVIDFQAFDLYRIDRDGRIAENWHLEDNLTLMQQFGVVKH